MALTKDHIINNIHEKIGYPHKEASFILETFLEMIKSRLEQGEDVKISRFGAWRVKEKRARPGRNPASGETIKIEARKVVAFHPADQFRKKVNASYNGEIEG
jgi:integration host factor subunit alpha